MPPTQSPFRLDAEILSRMRSEVTSRSNWANDSSTFRVSRPIEVVVLNCWVTDTKDTPCSSNSSTSLAKSANERVRRSTLYTTMIFTTTIVMYWTAFVYHFLLASEISMLGTSIPLVMEFAKSHDMHPLLLGMIWTLLRR